MAEWSKALVLGTSLCGGVGSNPTTAIFDVINSAFFSYSNDKVCRKCKEEHRLPKMEMRGFEPRTSYMQSKRSTTELHPLIIYWWAAMAEWLRRWT